MTAAWLNTARALANGWGGVGKAPPISPRGWTGTSSALHEMGPRVLARRQPSSIDTQVGGVGAVHGRPALSSPSTDRAARDFTNTAHDQRRTSLNIKRTLSHKLTRTVCILSLCPPVSHYTTAARATTVLRRKPPVALAMLHNIALLFRSFLPLLLSIPIPNVELRLRHRG